MPELETVYVHTQDAVAPVADAVRRAGAVAVDTEFISESSYDPVLCLLQLATPEGIWIVDPLAEVDLAGLWQALTEPGRELVAVAAREEIRFCL